jgi:hypothetical protein
LEDVNYNEVLAQVNQFEEEGKYIKFKYHQEIHLVIIQLEIYLLNNNYFISEV